MEPEQPAGQPGPVGELSQPNSPVSQPPKKRKRGAQPGNKNALKHGLYAQNSLDLQRELNALRDLRIPNTSKPQPDESTPHKPNSQNNPEPHDFEDPDLDMGKRIDELIEWLEGDDDQPTFNLTPEIQIMRLAIRRLASLGEPRTLAEAIHMIRALSLATSSLARLIRTQHYVTPHTSRQEIFNAEVSQALTEIAKELNLSI
jgi:hypothetical protein